MRRIVAGSVLVLVLFLFLLPAGGSVSSASTTSAAMASEATASAAVGVAASADEPTGTTTPEQSGAGIGGLDPGADTPSATGRSEPSRTQRTVDTMIFVGLLVVFGVGVLVALWSARRSPPSRGTGVRRRVAARRWPR